MVNCDEDEITTFIDVCSVRVYETCLIGYSYDKLSR